MNILDLKPVRNESPTSFWEEISHPFMWVREADLPRLKHNASLPFWKSKFDAWRAELDACEQLTISGDLVDFHTGDNTAALKAALCYVVDEKEHYGRLIGSFLSQVAALYRRSPDWRQIMGTPGMGYGTGMHWGGLTHNHIVDPQIWLSTAHLYDVIYGKGYISDEDAADFESMMALFYQLSCLHEEMHKMDNNRSVWLCAGGYISTMFDRNRGMADASRERLRGMMPRFLDTILEDGLHYEIGGYGPGTVAAMQIFARVIRGAEGIDYFNKKVDGVGFEEFYRAIPYCWVPGETSLRLYSYRDRISHWESLAAGYLEYDVPELGWALSRMHERNWVPMFLHWPQGFEFYTYKEPVDVKPPERCNNVFKSTGMAFLRASWEQGAASLHFRYGFQGSSHGGGLDKLNVEITRGDETLIVDPIVSERSYDKNVVIVDGECQEQCSGKLLYEHLDDASAVQCVSAVGGFGEWPQREFLNDPRTEIHYWCPSHDECFPGKARMRRTVAQIMNSVYVVRDTLYTLDGGEHDYEWLWHTFNQPTFTGDGKRQLFRYSPKKRFYSERLSDQTFEGACYRLSGSSLHCAGDRANLDMSWSVFGANAPSLVGHTQLTSRYDCVSTPETGERFVSKMLNRIHLSVIGRDVAMTTVFWPRSVRMKESGAIISIKEHSLDQCEMSLQIDGRNVTVLADEECGEWNIR